MVKQTGIMVSAHTGSGIAPDNTMASFVEGATSGADIVEVDVRKTKDDVAILLHDYFPLLQACTYEHLNMQGVRSKLSPIYEEHEIPRLNDILQVAAQYQVKLNLDIKDRESIEPAIESIKKFKAQDRIFITGCSEGITQLHSGIQVLMNTPDVLSEEEDAEYAMFAHAVCKRARDERYFGINMDFRTCRKEIVDTAHEHGLAVWVYTVNDPADMVQFMDMKVDAITTNNVDALMKIR